MVSTIINININVSSFEEGWKLIRLLKLGGDDDLEVQEVDVLERAISIAQGYIDRFEPFTYEDIGLPLELRAYRAPFREWLDGQKVDLWQGNIPGVKNFQGMLFRPFRINEAGERIPAPHPAEE